MALLSGDYWATPKPGEPAELCAVMASLSRAAISARPLTIMRRNKVATQVDAAREAFGERLGYCRLARRHRPVISTTRGW